MNTDDYPKLRAKRISELFPPCDLAYSFLLKAKDHRMNKEYLLNQMINFPKVLDSRSIFLSRSDAELFGFQDVDILQVPIKEYIDFSIDELNQVLNNPYFSMNNQEVWLTLAPEILVDKTLLVFRHLNPNMSEEMIMKELNKNILIANYHYHKLDFNPYLNPIPPLMPPESFFLYDEIPPPQIVLLSIFCAYRTDTIPINQIMEIRKTQKIYIGPDEKTIDISTVLGNFVDVVVKNHMFELVDDLITVNPPILFTNNITFSNHYQYRENGIPTLLKLSPDSLDKSDENIDSDSKIAEKLFPYFEKMMENIKSNVNHFTKLEIFQHICAQYIGYDKNVFGEDTKIPVNQILDSIQSWINEYAEDDFVLQMQNKISKPTDESELPDSLKELLQPNQRNPKINALMDQIGNEYPFLRPDAPEIEKELLTEDNDPLKLQRKYLAIF